MVWALENPWMLSWALAAIIPLVLYLLRRRQIDTVPWAAIQFLRASVAAQSRRINFKQLLMLLIRMSLLVLLGICVATPFFKSDETATGGTDRQPRRHWILVFDVSLSMAYTKQTESVLDLARDQGISLLNEIADNDLVTVVAASSSEPLLLARESTSRNTERQIIEKLSTQYGIFDGPATIKIIESVVDSPTRADVDQTNVVVLSDTAGSSWDWVSEPRSLDSFSRIANQAAISIIQCGDETSPNLSVTQLTSTPERITLGQIVNIRAEVTGFDLPAPQPTRLTLFVNDKPVAEKTIVVPPNSPSIVTFPHEFSLAGDHIIRVSLEPDNLSRDNQRWALVRSRDRIRLLCVEGFPGAARSVTAAIAETRDSAVPQIVSDVVSQDELDSQWLSDVDFLCLCDVGPADASQATDLSDFVLRGGRALWVLGPNTNTSWLNQWLEMMETGEQGRHVELKPEVKQGEFTFDPLDYQHPIIKIFENHWRAGLVDVPTWRYRTAAIDTERVQTILNFDSGDPALFTYRVGSGRLFILVTPLTSPIGSPDPNSNTGTLGERWNALDAWWSFVPLVNELIVWAFGESDLPLDQRIGESLVCRFPMSNFRHKFLVVQPDGNEIVYDAEPTSSGVTMVQIAPVSMPGVYEIKPVGSPAPGQRLAVNADPHEADLRRRSIEPLRPFLSSLEESREAVVKDPRMRSHRLLVICLGTLLALMVIEVVAAFWLGSNFRTQQV